MRKNVPLTIIIVLAACAPEAEVAPQDQTPLVTEIEVAVGQMLPTVKPGQYARIYAFGADGHIRALYTKECGEGWATCAEAKVMWVEPEALPPGPMDGGCGVVHVEYDPANHALVTAVCNGEA